MILAILQKFKFAALFSIFYIIHTSIKAFNLSNYFWNFQDPTFAENLWLAGSR